MKDNKKGYKNASCTLPILEVKVSGDKKTVEGYFASFNNIDSDGDKIRKGAFDKSIQEHGPSSESNRKIAHLAYHDTRRPLGVIEELYSDEKGLYFRSTLGEHTDGKDFGFMYNDGIIREHSIGFNYIYDKMDFIEIEEEKATNDIEKMYGGYWDIQEVKLWEGSAVVFGANSETPNLSIIKSQDDLNNHLEEINERMEVFIKALTDDNLSKKYNELFVLELMQLKEQYNSLLKFEKPIEKITLQDQEPNLKEQEEELKRRILLS
jgi:hypothetical protein